MTVQSLTCAGNSRKGAIPLSHSSVAIAITELFEEDMTTAKNRATDKKRSPPLQPQPEMKINFSNNDELDGDNTMNPCSAAIQQSSKNATNLPPVIFHQKMVATTALNDIASSSSITPINPDMVPTPAASTEMVATIGSMQNANFIDSSGYFGKSTASLNQRQTHNSVVTASLPAVLDGFQKTSELSSSETATTHRNLTADFNAVNLDVSGMHHTDATRRSLQRVAAAVVQTTPVHTSELVSVVAPLLSSTGRPIRRSVIYSRWTVSPNNMLKRSSCV